MIELILILENENSIIRHECGSSEDLENVLKCTNLEEYCYKNILFLVDGELNIPMSKIYKKRYITNF